MELNQTVINNTFNGLTDYISFLSDMYLNMVEINDLNLRITENKLMYLINIRRALLNYGYSTAFLTDDELSHLIQQVTIVTDELPNNSIYG